MHSLCATRRVRNVLCKNLYILILDHASCKATFADYIGDKSMSKLKMEMRLKCSNAEGAGRIWRAGPYFSRIDLFLLIGPRPMPTNANLHFLSKLRVCTAVPARIQRLSCFERPKQFSKFLQRSIKNTVETRFITTIKIHQNLALQSSRYSDEIVAISQNVFPASKVRT